MVFAEVDVLSAAKVEKKGYEGPMDQSFLPKYDDESNTRRYALRLVYDAVSMDYRDARDLRFSDHSEKGGLECVVHGHEEWHQSVKVDIKEC